jgi:hypothetical protein
MAKEEIPQPGNLSKPLSGFGEKENEVVAESELAGGVWLEKLAVGARLEVTTRNHIYMIEKREDGLYISGNPKRFPEPTKIEVHGSKFAQKGSMVKMNFIGRGMYLEFKKSSADHKSLIVTSEIQDVREL